MTILLRCFLGWILMLQVFAKVNTRSLEENNINRMELTFGNFKIFFYYQYQSLALQCNDEKLSNFNNNISSINERYTVKSMTFGFCNLEGNADDLEKIAKLADAQHVLSLGFVSNGPVTIKKDSFKAFQKLTTLNFNGNNTLVFEPHAFADLQSLELIYIRDNGHVSLPEKLFQKPRSTGKNNKTPNSQNFPNLTTIYLANNGIDELPKDLFRNLINLQFLDISANFLTSLHREIFQGLINLQTLCVSHNDLDRLPENIFTGLVNLRFLNLSHNKLTAIPDKLFTRLYNLQEVNFNDNNIRRLRLVEFDKLPNLNVVHCRHNCLQMKNRTRRLLYSFHEENQKICNATVTPKNL